MQGFSSILHDLRQDAHRLSPAELVRRLNERSGLLAALQARDRMALRSARQAVLDAALVQPGSPAVRCALRALAWRMAALLPAAIRRGQI